MRFVFSWCQPCFAAGFEDARGVVAHHKAQKKARTTRRQSCRSCSLHPAECCSCSHRGHLAQKKTDRTRALGFLECCMDSAKIQLQSHPCRIRRKREREEQRERERETVRKSQKREGVSESKSESQSESGKERILLLTESKAP